MSTAHRSRQTDGALKRRSRAVRGRPHISGRPRKNAFAACAIGPVTTTARIAICRAERVNDSYPVL